nr:MAG TPA: hypothetical protein [Caudoviricetes sp.]
MAEEVNNTENTENGNVQQDTNTGAANTEPEKKYSEEEMNGISKKNSEKAVAKVLRELGITDRVKAKEILSKAAAEEAANSENNGTGEEMSQIQQALAKERERADGAVLESLLLAAHVDAKKVAKAARLVERDKCVDDDGIFDREKASTQVAELLKEWPELVVKVDEGNVGFVIGGDGKQGADQKKTPEKKVPQKRWNRFN